MVLTDLQIFSALRTKMHWHESRQGVLAENIANADTPGYSARDLRPVDFSSHLRVAQAGNVNTRRTNVAHIDGPGIGDDTPFDINRRVQTFEVTPEGNSVVLEEEMMKATANQLDYQTVATLYQRGIGMLRTAIGRRG